MCFLFFHSWTMWSEPFKVERVPMDEVGNVLGPGYSQLKQTRKCVECGKYQARYV